MTMPEKTSMQVYRGDSVGVLVRVWEDVDKTQPADLSGAVVRSQIRTEPNASAVVAEFDVEVVDNAITLYLLPKQSQELEPQGVFDVQVDWSGGAETDVQTILVGAISCSPDTTRSTP